MPLDHAKKYMQRAIELARQSALTGEVPVGAIVVSDGRIIAEAHNSPRTNNDPTAHAEIEAIRNAAAHIGSERLNNCDLWVTLEPCAMCAGAISHARIRRLYYAASDPKGGAIEHGPRIFEQNTTLHKPDVYNGICAEEVGVILKDFFAKLRK